MNGLFRTAGAAFFRTVHLKPSITKEKDMALINTVSPEKAEGAIKDAYDKFMKNIGIIPRPMEMMSVSPVLFDLHLQRIRYFSKHPTLGFPLLAHIRYLVAHNLNYGFCTDFNRHILKKLGLGEADILKVEADPASALLEARESAMLAFVIKSVKTPEAVTAEDIQSLRDLGWEDRDMMDALSHGVSMIDHAIMMQVFQMDQNCMIG